MWPVVILYFKKFKMKIKFQLNSFGFLFCFPLFYFKILYWLMDLACCFHILIHHTLILFNQPSFMLSLYDLHPPHPSQSVVITCLQLSHMRKYMSHSFFCVCLISFKVMSSSWIQFIANEMMLHFFKVKYSSEYADNVFFFSSSFKLEIYLNKIFNSKGKLGRRCHLEQLPPTKDRLSYM